MQRRCGPAQLSELAGAIRRTITAWERAFPSAERLRIVKYNEDCWFHPVTTAAVPFPFRLCFPSLQSFAPVLFAGSIR